MILSSFQRVLATTLALTLAAPLVEAHSAFFVPSSTVLSKPQWVTIDGGVGTDMFYFNHGPLRLDGLVVTAPDGTAVTPENLVVGKVRSVFDLNLTQTGTYRIATANSGVTARYKDKATGQNKGFRGTAANFEKEVPADAEDLQVNESVSRLETFVTVGRPSAFTPTGVGLELIAVTHPNDLYSGEEATFAFVLDGKPAVGLEVEVVPGGVRYRDKIGEIALKTDAQGRVTLKWPQPGLYRLEVNAKDGQTTVKQARERRLGYAVVLEVLSQ
ncbi:MAG: ABC transporter permease [Burkholderiales bacterium PBB1]|nr:MAG: ABC transporter permease [Burkholderiales bacterium PBB1]